MLLFVALVAGGSSGDAISALIVRLASLPVAGLAIWRLARHGVPPGGRAPLALVIAAIVLTLLQLAPLPPAVWSVLPGRQVAIGVYRAVGMPLPWLPISLTPAATWNGALALAPPAAMVCATLALDVRARRIVALAVPVAALLGVVVGGLQVSQGADSPLRLYYHDAPDIAVGFFGNQDFDASLLVAAIPFTALLGGEFARASGARRWFWMAGTGAAVLVLVVGIAATRSRAGVLLAVPAAVGGAWIWAARMGREDGEGRWRRRAPALVALGSAALGAVLVATLNLSPIASRFNEPLSGDLRLQLAPNTVRLGLAYAPTGSGFGSFETVYETIEQPGAMLGTSPDHAHNDFLEVWLEAGWAGAALIGLFLVWFAGGAWGLVRHADRDGAGLGLVGALVAALLLAHSLVEFPLRTPALATLFAFACGLIVLPHGGSSVDSASKGDVARGRGGRQAFER